VEQTGFEPLVPLRNRCRGAVQMNGDPCLTFRNGRIPARDYKFESASQRRVTCEPKFTPKSPCGSPDEPAPRSSRSGLGGIPRSGRAVRPEERPPGFGRRWRPLSLRSCSVGNVVRGAHSNDLCPDLKAGGGPEDFVFWASMICCGAGRVRALSVEEAVRGAAQALAPAYLDKDHRDLHN
jgi:hypothetical protein